MVQVFERWPLPQGKGADDFVEGFALAQQQKRQQEQLAMQKEQAEAARRKEARQAIEDIVNKFARPYGEQPTQDTFQVAGMPEEVSGPYQPQQEQGPLQEAKSLAAAKMRIRRDQTLSSTEQDDAIAQLDARYQEQANEEEAANQQVQNNKLMARYVYQQRIRGKALPLPTTHFGTGIDPATGQERTGFHLFDPLTRTSQFMSSGQQPQVKDRIPVEETFSANVAWVTAAENSRVSVPFHGQKRELGSLTYEEALEYAGEMTQKQVRAGEALRRTMRPTGSAGAPGPGTATTPGQVAVDEAVARITGKTGRPSNALVDTMAEGLGGLGLGGQISQPGISAPSMQVPTAAPPGVPGPAEMWPTMEPEQVGPQADRRPISVTTDTPRELYEELIDQGVKLRRDGLPKDAAGIALVARQNDGLIRRFQAAFPEAADAAAQALTDATAEGMKRQAGTPVQVAPGVAPVQAASPSATVPTVEGRRPAQEAPFDELGWARGGRDEKSLHGLVAEARDTYHTVSTLKTTAREYIKQYEQMRSTILSGRGLVANVTPEQKAAALRDIYSAEYATMVSIMADTRTSKAEKDDASNRFLKVRFALGLAEEAQ